MGSERGGRFLDQKLGVAQAGNLPKDKQFVKYF